MTTSKNPIVRLRDYIRASFEEAKKITWPTRKETVRYSMLVLVITILVAGFFAGLDFLFSSALKAIV